MTKRVSHSLLERTLGQVGTEELSELELLLGIGGLVDAKHVHEFTGVGVRILKIVRDRRIDGPGRTEDRGIVLFELHATGILPIGPVYIVIGRTEWHEILKIRGVLDAQSRHLITVKRSAPRSYSIPNHDNIVITLNDRKVLTMANIDKTPALYLIRNKINGKEYVGATHDIGRRMKQYISDYERVTREEDRRSVDQIGSNTQLMSDMIKYGWNNFEFIILEIGGELFDPMTRAIREVEEMVKRRTILPKFGYNGSIGGESGNLAHRSFHDGRIRTLFVYDTMDDSMWYSIGGTKAVASLLGVKPIVLPDAASRCNLVKNRYYIFYANKDQRDYAYRYLIMYREMVEMNGSNGSDAQYRINLYKKAYNAIDAYALKLGFK